MSCPRSSSCPAHGSPCASPDARPALAFLGLTLIAGYWLPRYFLSLLVIASALAALVLERLATVVGRIKRAPSSLTAVGLVGAVVLTIAAGCPRWTRQWRDVRALWTEGREAFLEGRVRFLAVAQWLNTHLSQGEKVAIGFNVQPFYYLERPYYHIHPLTSGDLVSAQTPEDVEAALRRTGASVLAFSPTDGTYFEDTAPGICAYRSRLSVAVRQLRLAGRLRLLATVGGVRIFRLE